MTQRRELHGGKGESLSSAALPRLKHPKVARDLVYFYPGPRLKFDQAN